MPDELVSVVIPTYNKGSLIEVTLNSVLHQTYSSIEVILVDNGSTDETRQIIDDFLLLHPRGFRVIDLKENLGPSNARNVGILEAKGKYVFLLDGDDIFLPEKIENQVRYMDNNPSVGLSLTPYLIYAPAHRFSMRLVSELDPSKLIQGWIGMSHFGGLVESTGCIRRSNLDSTLLFDLSLMGSEGLDFTIKWLDRFSIGILEKPLTIYRISSYQLHHDVSAISENVTRVTNKYILPLDAKTQLLEQQAAFFRLNAIRFAPKIRVVLYLFFCLLHLKTADIKMAWWILSRNIMGVIKGIPHKRDISSLLNTLANLETV